MESEKLLRILRAKAPFSEPELAAMSEAEGWRWVYQNRAEVRPVEQICFTGFSVAECEELHSIAATVDWLHVVTLVTTRLAFLCTGANAGPAKVAKARRQGVTFLDRQSFEALVRHGELPPRS